MRFLQLISSLTIASATPQIAFLFNSQVPPVARVGAPYSFQLSPSSFQLKNGSLRYSLINQPDWLQIDEQNGALSGTPKENDVGAPNFSIKGTDDTGSATMPATLVVKNTPGPQFTNSISNFTAQGQVKCGVNCINYPPNTNFSFQIPGTSFSPSNKIFSYATLTNHAPLPEWITYDDIQFTLSGTTPSVIDTADSIEIDFTVSEVEGFAADVEVLVLTVSKHQFYFSDLVETINVTIESSFKTSAFIDILYLDGSKTNHTSISSVTLLNSPSWIVLDPFTLSLSGSPPTDMLSSFNVTVRVNDNYGDAAFLELELRKLDHDLHINHIGMIEIPVGKQFSYHFNISNINSAKYNVSVDLGVASNWLQFDLNSLNISGLIPKSTPNQLLEAEVTVHNLEDQSQESQSFQLKITGESSSASSDSSSSTSSSTSSASRRKASIIAGSVVGAIFAVCLVILIIFYCRVRSQNKDKIHLVSFFRGLISRPSPQYSIKEVDIENRGQKHAENDGKAITVSPEPPKVQLNLNPKSKRRTWRFSGLSLSQDSEHALPTHQNQQQHRLVSSISSLPSMQAITQAYRSNGGRHSVMMGRPYHQHHLRYSQQQSYHPSMYSSTEIMNQQIPSTAQSIQISEPITWSSSIRAVQKLQQQQHQQQQQQHQQYQFGQRPSYFPHYQHNRSFQSSISNGRSPTRPVSSLAHVPSYPASPQGGGTRHSYSYVSPVQSPSRASSSLLGNFSPVSCIDRGYSPPPKPRSSAQAARRHHQSLSQMLASVRMSTASDASNASTLNHAAGASRPVSRRGPYHPAFFSSGGAAGGRGSVGSGSGGSGGRAAGQLSMSSSSSGQSHRRMSSATGRRFGSAGLGLSTIDGSPGLGADDCASDDENVITINNNDSSNNNIIILASPDNEHEHETQTTNLHSYTANPHHSTRSSPAPPAFPQRRSTRAGIAIVQQTETLVREDTPSSDRFWETTTGSASGSGSGAGSCNDCRPESPIINDAVSGAERRKPMGTGTGTSSHVANVTKAATAAAVAVSAPMPRVEVSSRTSSVYSRNLDGSSVRLGEVPAARVISAKKRFSKPTAPPEWKAPTPIMERTRSAYRVQGGLERVPLKVLGSHENRRVRSRRYDRNEGAGKNGKQAVLNIEREQSGIDNSVMSDGDVFL